MTSDCLPKVTLLLLCLPFRRSVVSPNYRGASHGSYLDSETVARGSRTLKGLPKKMQKLPPLSLSLSVEQLNKKNTTGQKMQMATTQNQNMSGKNEACLRRGSYSDFLLSQIQFPILGIVKYISRGKSWRIKWRFACMP